MMEMKNSNFGFAIYISSMLLNTSHQLLKQVDTEQYISYKKSWTGTALTFIKIIHTNETTDYAAEVTSYLQVLKITPGCRTVSFLQLWNPGTVHVLHGQQTPPPSHPHPGLDFPPSKVTHPVQFAETC